MPGLFITLEGGEGCGKSTQARLLHESFKNSGHPALLTREPGGSPGAEAIRALLVIGEAERWGALAETMLFFAARADHLEHTVKPALARGEAVICDRFADSTVVYQGIAKGLGAEYVRGLHRSVFGDFMPSLTLLLDIALEEGLKRAAARRGGENRFEQMDLTFHQKLREGFLSLAQAEPKRFAVIDAAQTQGQVHERIIGVIKEKLAVELKTC